MKKRFLQWATVLIIIAFLAGQTVFSQDVGVTQVVSPPDSSAWNMNDSYTVTVKVQNFGASDASSFPIVFKAGNNNPLYEVYTGTLTAGATMDFTFSQKQWITSSSSKNGTSFTELSGDSDLSNDTTVFYCIFTTWPSGIDDNSNNSNLGIRSLYVHPNSGYLDVILNNNNGGRKISVHVVNILGNEVSTSNYYIADGNGDLHIDVSDLVQGVYFVFFRAEDRIIKKKFVILQ